MALHCLNCKQKVNPTRIINKFINYYENNEFDEFDPTIYGEDDEVIGYTLYHKSKCPNCGEVINVEVNVTFNPET